MKRVIKTDPNETILINGVTIIPGDKTMKISELEKIFTGSGIDAKKLREDAWKRKHAQ
ncbi:MAG: hypothetical protein ACHQIM_05590 [Sphingobacteriales bacterium]